MSSVGAIAVSTRYEDAHHETDAMLGLSPWYSFAAAVLAAALAWTQGRRGMRDVPGLGLARSGLASRWAPVAFGALTSALVAVAWGGLDRAPIIHDEAAYVLQAELFARGAWTGRAPVLPEFFEQLYVLVTPVLASKYPPGHSLMLAPGALIGLPGLSVLLLDGVTGALIFALARRAAGSAAALLTWILWVTCFPAIYFRAGYLSEVTSSAGWLAAWWCLLQWRGDGRRGPLLGVAASVGLVAITRPLTAFALALPIAVVVIRGVAARRMWRDLGLAVVVGALCVSVIPLWSARTTGSAFVTPLELYTRTYVPFDRPGFGLDTTARPQRPVPRDMAITNASFREEHRLHTAAAVPRTLATRLRMIARDIWYDWRLGLAPFAVLALAALPAAAWFALATLAAHVALYLLYAHPAFWTVYYLESEPVLAFVTAAGLAWTLRWAARRGARLGPHRDDAGGEGARGGTSRALLASVLVLAAAAVLPASMTLGLMRDQVNRDHAYFERFDALVRGIRDERAIVFVRYAPAHNDNLSLVRNPANHDEARVWIVHDRGEDNERLVAAAPNRRPYLFDEASWSLQPLHVRARVENAADP